MTFCTSLLRTSCTTKQSYRYYVVYVCRIFTTDVTGTTLVDDVYTFNIESVILGSCIVSVLFCCCVLIANSLIKINTNNGPMAGQL